MNNYCRNCGRKLESGEKKCINCDAEVLEKRINVESKRQELAEYKKKENRYIILTIFLYVLSYLVNFESYFNFLSSYSSLIFLGSIMTAIYARITLNNSKNIKTMFNVFILVIIINFLFVLLLITTCESVIDMVC